MLSPMKTRGQLEAEISDALKRFEKEYMGRGPSDVRTRLFDDTVFVRLFGVLTPAEQQLIALDNSQEGRRLVKRMRMELLENARALLDAVIYAVTGCTVVSLHTDISTVTGERVIIFILNGSPMYQEL